MKGKHVSKMLVMVFALALLFGCAAQTGQIPFSPFSPSVISGNDWEPKVDNFIVVLDASYSMDEMDNELYKYGVAKAVVERMAQTMPAMDVTGELRSFGSDMGKSDGTRVLYGPTAYTRTAFLDGLAKAPMPSGNTPMATALNAASDDLGNFKGKTAVIIVSDGLSSFNSPVEAATAMKDKYGDRVCIYTIHIGSNPVGEKRMKEIADAGGCGFASKATDLLSSAAMADFVEKVFIWRYTDSDGDGVWDHLDKCPGTPRGVKVDKDGCPLPESDKDSDGDGVFDKYDRCPGTPKGAKANADGCWVLGHVLFDFDKSVIKVEAYPLLDEVVMVLKNNPGVNVRLDGHTDDIGTEAYNKGLSERRAEAVKAYLVSKGIPAGRLTTRGLGKNRPVTDDRSEAGRAQNRRVEIQTVM